MARFNHTHDDEYLMTERSLADRWKMSQRTLQRWRQERLGPTFMNIGGAIRYRYSDILAFEARSRRGGEGS